MLINEEREKDQQAIIDEKANKECFKFTEAQLISMLQGTIELFLILMPLAGERMKRWTTKQ